MRRLLAAFLFLCTLPAGAQKLSGPRAYTFAKQFVTASGPRWIGSPGHQKAEDFLRGFFGPEKKKGTFEEDSFSMNTPIGLLPMRNFIVRYPGKKDGLVVVATHYETNYPLKDTGFVGANDGGATTGLLLELATYYRTHPNDGYTLVLLFDDGEEAIQSWTNTDSLYGTRHLAAKWSNDGTLKRIKAFIITDMIGDRDLNLNYELNSTPWLRDTLHQAAKNTGHLASVFKSEQEVSDDHLPFKQRGVPVLDMIDIDYGPHTAAMPDGWHHTPQDTLDKISAHSLQISADLLLETLHLINQH
jgi:glutaminyl-peptide cyclotransferase